MLYGYGMKIGLGSILHGHLGRESLKNVVVPANYWRTLEYRLVFEELSPDAGDRILDIGSPKLLSLFLADKCRATVYATDIEDYFIRDYSFFRSLRGIPEDRYHLLQADGRKLLFEDCSFGKAFSISVLEHIPGEGDSDCMREIGRILQPGGLSVVTVPFAPVSRDEYRQPDDFYWSSKSGGKVGDGEVFFQRRYSEADLHSRLIRPSTLAIRKIGFFGDRIALRDGREISSYLPPLTGVIQPLASRIFTAGPAASWKEIPSPLGAILVLEKNR